MLLNPPTKPAIVLVHSPLIGPASWGAVPTVLAQVGYEVVMPDVEPTAPNEPLAAFIGAMNVAIATGLGESARPLVLVAQHEAGAALPHIGAAQRAAGRTVARYVLLNALLPKPYGARGASNMLDLIESGDSGRADALRGLLLDGVSFPQWSAPDLTSFIQEAAARDAVVAQTRPRDFAWYATPIPPVGEWPDAPVTYIASASECEWEAKQSELRGWQVVRCGGSTFAAINEPKHVVAAIDSALINN